MYHTCREKAFLSGQLEYRQGRFESFIFTKTPKACIAHTFKRMFLDLHWTTRVCVVLCNKALSKRPQLLGVAQGLVCAGH